MVLTAEAEITSAAKAPESWNARLIGSALVRQTFQRKYLVVPNCIWPGSECDLLAVEPGLRLIEVEIKISRADLRADRDKDKWYHHIDWRQQRAGVQRPRRDWPTRIWKHYYALPKDIWSDELRADLGSPASGILLLAAVGGARGPIAVTCRRRSKPCRDAQRLTAAQAIDIARLANLRMWDAYRDLERCRADSRAIHALTKAAP